MAKRAFRGSPANSTLVFDVELLDIKAAPKADAAAPEAAPAAGDKAADPKAADASKK